jgi:hypothetical protein
LVIGNQPEVLPGEMGFKPLIGQQHREKGYYYRQITVKGGEMVWVKTCLLPFDAEGQKYYLSKGFRLQPPPGVEFEPKSFTATPSKVVSPVTEPAEVKPNEQPKTE